MNDNFKSLNWNPPESCLAIHTIDMHTGGEPLRIPIRGLPEIAGNSVLEKRKYFRENYDYLRTGLMFEPRGHADMYGAIISKPTTEDADFDVFFIHNEGYSTMCGHAVIALTKFAFETGLVADKEKNTLIMNVPAGTIHAEANIVNDRVVESSFTNVPSYLYKGKLEAEVPGIGMIAFDIAFGGAFYAIVNAASVGLELTPEYYNQLIDYGRRIKNVIVNQFEISHPTQRDLSFLYGTIFTAPPVNPVHHSRNVCIFANGEVDRSATGSGVSARAGVLFAKDKLRMHEKITIESILGSTMAVEIIKTLDYHGHTAVIPKVTGSAFFIGAQNLYFNPEDPYSNGFIFR